MQVGKPPVHELIRIEDCMFYLVMEGISKYFPENGVQANSDVNLVVNKNEIHAIIGENGAGKSTLMKILYGLVRADKGVIKFKGQKVDIHSPMDANRLGIGMVHQHFQLIREFSVAENVVMGTEPRKRGVFFNRTEAVRRVTEVIEKYGFNINAEAQVSNLTVGQMQQVEIVKILYRKAELLILDEPTSVLTEQEIKRLFESIRELKRQGKTFIIITHKLDEVKEISDRVTVMRKGEVVALKETKDVDKKKLAELMVGKSVLFELEKENIAPGKVIFELKDVALRLKGQERPLLDGINLKVRSGEIVGIAGVGGNGLGELENVVSGLFKVSEGEILYRGENIAGPLTSKFREKGLGYVPADRLNRGSSLQSSVRENIIVTCHHNFLRNGVFNQRKINDFVEHLSKDYSISGDASVPIGTLSGGNIQKVILARELAVGAEFIVFSEPTWGLDVASSEFIYENILKLRKKGVAILLISSNLDEIMALADRILVMYRGRITGRFKNDSGISKYMIGEYMMGIRDDYRKVPVPEDVSTVKKGIIK